MQHIEILGNLGADPDIKFNQKGTATMTFRVGVRTSVFEDGGYVDHTEWFSVTNWNRIESFQRRLAKGTRVLVKGDFQLRKFIKKNGEAGQSLDIRAFDIQVIGQSQSHRDSDDVEDDSAGNGTAPAGASGAQAGSDPDLSDLPFLLPRHIQEPWLYWRAP